MWARRWCRENLCPPPAGDGLHGPCQLFGLLQGQTCRPTLTHGLSRSEGQRSGTSLPDAGGCHYMSTEPIVKDTRGLKGPNSSNLARTQAKTAINHPDATVTEGGRAQGQASPRARGIAADDGASR